jgi:5-hydroxyisourate hydrolase-like protein (transthyretin family)
MLKFRMTIEPRTGYEVSVRVEEFEDGRWKFIDFYVTDSQSISSALVWEREKVSEGLYDLEIIDNRPYFTMV